MMTMPREWILVLNAQNARLIAGLGAGAAERRLEAELPRPAQVMADRPGRSFASAGTGRRAGMEPSADPVREAERAFAGQVVEMVEAARLAGEFDKLAVFAAPEMLGLLRKAMPRALRAALSREVARNLAGLDAPRLHDALRDEMALK